jgi:hypothetical protein
MMIVCPECGTLELTIGTTVTTCTGFLPFQDAEGRTHYHDRNRKTTSVTCRNGHRWDEEVANVCWCGWNSLALE